MSSWHRSGCHVGPDDLNRVQLVRVRTLEGERTLEYQCDECGATHVIIAGRTNHRAGQTP